MKDLNKVVIYGLRPNFSKETKSVEQAHDCEKGQVYISW